MSSRTALPRACLTVHEAAFVLQEPERAVRRRLRRDELCDVGAGRGVRIDGQQLAALITGQPLREQILQAVLARTVTVPRPAERNGPPEGIEIAIDQLRLHR